MILCNDTLSEGEHAMTDFKVLCYNRCYGADYVRLYVTPCMVLLCLIKFHIKLYVGFRVLHVPPEILS